MFSTDDSGTVLCGRPLVAKGSSRSLVFHPFGEQYEGRTYMAFLILCICGAKICECSNVGLRGIDSKLHACAIK